MARNYLRPEARKSQTHAQLVAAILDTYGSRVDILMYKNHVGVARALRDDIPVRFGVPGSADILGVMCRKLSVHVVDNAESMQPYDRHVDMTIGHALAIECKVGRDVVRKNQRLWAEAWQRMGGLYILARSLKDCFPILGVPDNYEPEDDEPPDA